MLDTVGKVFESLGISTQCDMIYRAKRSVKLTIRGTKFTQCPTHQERREEGAWLRRGAGASAGWERACWLREGLAIPTRLLPLQAPAAEAEAPVPLDGVPDEAGPAAAFHLAPAADHDDFFEE